MLSPEIVNAVGGGDLQQELDLEALYKDISANEIRYDPEHWPGLYIRFNDCSPAVMVFRTGKYNIAGADSVDELIDGNKTFLSVMSDLDLTIHNPSFEIRNLVFLERYDKELNLEHIAVKLGLENTEYEPEQFPGLLYRSTEFVGTFLLFRNGKIILTGADSLEGATGAFKNLFNRLDDLFN
jgi:transcription initiation factor TFIID TATA-box-binding protein